MQSEHGATDLLHKQSWFILVLPKNVISGHVGARVRTRTQPVLRERALHLVVRLWLAFIPFPFAGHDGVRESRNGGRNTAI